MVDATKLFVVIFSVLFPIVVTPSEVPIFLELTDKYSTSARLALSGRVAWYSFLLLIGSYFVGSHILHLTVF